MVPRSPTIEKPKRNLDETEPFVPPRWVTPLLTPFVAGPTSSIDLSLATGNQIPIEQRDPREIMQALGRTTAPDAVDIYNPAFDITPADLVTAIITEHGVARPPYGESLRKLCG